MQADLFDKVRHDPKAAPAGYFAVLKADAKPKGDSNICRACDWRPECQRPETDFTDANHRCMPWAREDGSSVLFKRVTPNVELSAGAQEPAKSADGSPAAPT